MGNDESMRETALRLAIEEEKKRKTDANDTHERSIIILGSKGVGKTTMVYRFLEKDEKPKPTIAMDYSFGRKTVKSLVKNIVHVYEVGHLASSLVSVAMTGSTLTHSPHHTALLMMLDLSRPEELWASFEEIMSAIRNGLKMSYDSDTIEELRERRKADRKKELERGVDPFPMKICIIGGRYDEFKIYVSRIPQLSKNDEGTLEDPSNDPNFNEPIIDRLRVQREEEISVLLNDMMEGRMPKIPVPDPF
ncbi:Cytoplasmic dynein 2 light intermediate chain [Ooceraea biroi]|uniref:Cytoplasmic dynein 2 light intermediate chain 1 n=1 Tax=Ooceraea biroi TaxID=2015173 RepID=A0A026W9C4_OOCBI|nr:Cytoplasmic dynein 2 light intermediate chain [Ooceraea biroi]